MRNGSDETRDDDHDDTRRDGGGRHPRSTRRRLRPLLDRRPVARPALREDAVRQRAAHARVPARVSSSPARTATARSSTTSSATCCAICADASGGFFSAEDADSEGVEGKFYCWSIDEIRDVCGDDAEAAIALLRRHRERELRRPAHQVPREHPARRRTATLKLSRSRTCEVSTARPARETRIRPGLDDKVLLGWNALMPRRAHRSRGRARPRRLDGRRPDQRTLPARASSATTPDACFAPGVRPYLAYAEDYAALLEALSPSPSSTTSRGSSDAPQRRRRAPPPLLRRRGRWLLHDRSRRRAARRPAQGHLRRRDAVRELDSPPTGCCASPRSPAKTRYAEPALAVLRHARRAAASHPTGFAYLLGALERSRVAARSRSSIVGDPDDRPHRGAAPRGRRPAGPGVGHAHRPGADDRPAPRRAATRRDGCPTAYVCEHYTCRATRDRTRRAARAARCRCWPLARRRQQAATYEPAASSSATAQPNAIIALPRVASSRRRATRSSRRRSPSPGSRRAPARTAACGP